MSEQEPPAGLGDAGRQLWREVVDEFELSGEGMELLRQAARTVDELELLRDALGTEKRLTVQGSTGQPRAHPLLAEVRAHRQTLARLLAALDLPGEDEEGALTAKQLRARAAASARWRERHKEQEAARQRHLELLPGQYAGEAADAG